MKVSSDRPAESPTNLHLSTAFLLGGVHFIHVSKFVSFFPAVYFLCFTIPQGTCFLFGVFRDDFGFLDTTFGGVEMGM